MKDKIIMIILFVSIILVICLAVFGLKVGSFEIPSISDLVNKNSEINSNIDLATNLTSIDYPEQITTLESTIDSLNIQKEKYDEISGLSLEDNAKIYETEKYDIGYLWTSIGQYATKNKLNLAMDVKRSIGTDLYDLYFTVEGEYVNISSFVTKLENDSYLSFRIYNFKITPGEGDNEVTLKAAFVVKDVNIDDKTLNKQSINESSTITEQGNNVTENNSENVTQNESQQ